MKNYSMKKIIIPVILAFMMILIFCFSAQPAEESTETSSSFSILAAKLIYRDYDSYDAQTQTLLAEGLTYFVRKTAHFTEYALMGFLWYLLLSNRKNNILLSVGAVALYAASDECHQLFVAGRSGQISDVILDTCGGFFGVCTAFVILSLRYCLTHQNITEKFVWKK